VGQKTRIVTNCNTPEFHLRIVCLNNFSYLRGGSEKVLFEEMRMLETKGHEVAIFSRDHKQNIAASYSSYFPPAIDTERLKPSVQTLKTVKELVYSNTVRACLSKVVHDFKPDLAHGHNIYGRLSTSVLDELKAQEVPTVLTLHDLKLLCPSYLMLNHGQVCEKCKGGKFHHAVLAKCHKGSYLASAVYAFESWFNLTFNKYGSVNYFISPSCFLRDKCIEFGWPADKIVHVPNFVDTHVLKSSPGFGDYLLYLGRLSREKGMRTLLQALAGLKSVAPLLVVGDGPERADLERFATERKLNVRFAGYLSGSQLEASVSNAKAVIMPSEWYENAPLSLLESFGCGKPVIGARIGGIPEMIDDGVNGYLFEPGNVVDLQTKLELLLGHSAQRIAEMGKAAREKVEQEYSVEAHYEKLIQVYTLALGRPCA